MIGARQAVAARDGLEALWTEGFQGSDLLVLDRIENYRRLYSWA
jgi:hypothetical protein